MSDDPGLVRQEAQGNYIAQATHGGVANVQVVLPPAPVQEQNRVRFLKRLSAEYERQWEQALQGARPMILGLTSRPDAVRHHTEKFFRGPNLPERQLSADTSIVEIYDQSGHELLILGEPGAGKSTLLLELARHLVEHAQQDLQQPFPIILPLSSWAVKQPSLVDWLAEQLALLYDVPHQLSRQWVQADQILPLLDGLDEVPQGARVACIEAIGAYRKEHVVPLVVCSRQAEYEEITRQKRLVLQSAVVVQPLTQEQVDACLLRTDQALVSVLHSNEALRGLTTTPLMLNILTQTYEGAAEQALSFQGTAEEQQRQVLAAYVEQMVLRKGDEERYPLEYTRSRLGWLARQMRERNQTVFYLEHLQPDWLAEKQRYAYSRLAVRLPAIVIGIFVSLFVLMFFVGDTDLTALLQYSVLGGFLGGLFSTSILETNGVIVQKRTHQHLWGIRVVTSSFIGLLFSLSFGFNLGSVGSLSVYSLKDWLHDGLISGIVVGFSCLFLQTYFLFARTSNASLRLTRFLRPGYVQRFFLVAVVFGLSVALVEGLRYGLSVGPNLGFVSILVSLTLREQAEDIRLNERMKWTWRSLKRSLLMPKHVRMTSLILGFITLIFGLSEGLFLGVNSWLSIGLNYMLSVMLISVIPYGVALGLASGVSVALIYWLLFGLFQGISQERIEDQDRQVANQGIRHSLRNSVIMASLSGVIITIFSVPDSWLSIGISYWLSGVVSEWPLVSLNDWLGAIMNDGQNYVSVALWMGVSGCCFVFLLSGGLAVLRHYVIRLLLWRSQVFPWRAVAFLDDATVRVLLRRVGGGYSFSHRLLLDYLADRDMVTD